MGSVANHSYAQVPIWDGRTSGRLETAWRLLIACFRLRRAIQREHPDALVSWLALSTIITGLAKVGLGIPMLVAVRNGIPERAHALPYVAQLMALRWTITRSDMVVANSNAGLEGYARLGLLHDRPRRVIPNAIDRCRFRPANSVERCEARAVLGIGPSVRAVLYVGRASPEKNLPLLANTIARAMTILPDVCFVLIGVDKTQMSAAASVGLASDRILFSDRVEQIERAYWACDVLLLTSTNEGSPNVVHEARACGLPIVSTDCGDVLATATVLDRVMPADADALAGALREVVRAENPRRVLSNPMNMRDHARAWSDCIREALAVRGRGN
jgi:glycosyltransferase involved in cell wall biosynthesis